jgi:RNA polymerase I-specific transcription initiation factor RRN6
LVLFSQLTQVVQIFPCPFIADEQTETLSVPDPLILDAPLLADISPVQSDSGVKFSSFIFKEVAHSAALSKNYYYNLHLTVIKLFWMDSNLAVHESTFKGPQGDPDELDLHREDNILRLRKRYAPTKLVKVDDNFIVDDWDESVAPQKIEHRPKSKRAATRTGSDLQWTLDFSYIYDMVTGKATTNQTMSKQKWRPEPKPKTMDELIANLRNGLENSSTKQTPSETLLVVEMNITGIMLILHRVEMSTNRILGDDLDQSADDVKHLVSEIIPETQNPDAECRIVSLPLQFSRELQGMPVILSGDAGIALLQTYDGLVDDWMSNLSHHIPTHTRIMKEKVIRGIAADLLLSRFVRISNTLDDVTLPDPIERNEKDVAQNKILHLGYLPSSQIPASQAPMSSGAFGSHRNPGPVNQSKYAATPALSGLSAFTTFKTPRATPRNVENLLSHWSVGNNPSQYVWERIEDEETRRASRTNTPRNRRSQTRDSSLPPTPAVPTVRAWGSQPDGPPRVYLTSSQPMEGVSMTQTERGVFGARDPFKKPKAKKKKRAAGF